MLGIAVSLLSVTATGILMDQGKSIGMASAELIAPAFADDDNDGDDHDNKKESFADEALEGIHQLSGNLLLTFVGLHVGYLLIFKRSLAKFMLFIPKSPRKD